MHQLTSKQWWEKAGTRAIKTMAQTLTAMIGTGVIGIMDVSWVSVLSVTGMAGLVSLLTSLGGLPELEEEE